MKFVPLRIPTESRKGRRAAGSAVHAFTLVEVLAALLLMAIIIPVTMQGMSVASRIGVLGLRKAVAMRIAERVLNQIIVEGETAQASSSGNIVEGDTTYPWAMRTEPWPEDPMTLLTVSVTFSVQGNNYDVSASTLLPQPGTTVTVP
jgi:type II secretory pathway pseudopilin PulG